jgi:hypothetical protein
MVLEGRWIVAPGTVSGASSGQAGFGFRRRDECAESGRRSTSTVHRAGHDRCRRLAGRCDADAAGSTVPYGFTAAAIAAAASGNRD